MRLAAPSDSIWRSLRSRSCPQRRLDNLAGEIQEYYWGYLVDRDMLELRNLAEVAQLIVACAQERKESRGLHYTLSWTGQIPPRDTVLVRGKPAPSAWPR